MTGLVGRLVFAACLSGLAALAPAARAQDVKPLHLKVGTLK